MVHEQANLVFTIPFNLRWPVENNSEVDFMSILRLLLIISIHLDPGLAFPPPDLGVIDFLTRPYGRDVEAIEKHYVLFLLYTFQLVQVELQNLCKTVHAIDWVALAGFWRKHLEQSNVHNCLYEKVIEKVDNVAAVSTLIGHLNVLIHQVHA